MGTVGCWLSAKVGLGGHPEAQPGVGSTGIPLKQVVGRKQERREAKALPLNTLTADIRRPRSGRNRNACQGVVPTLGSRLICTTLLGAPRISWGEPAGSGWEKHRMQMKPNGPGQASGKCWVVSLAPSQLDVGCHPCWWQKKTFLTVPCFRPNVLEEVSTARGGGQGVLPFSFHGGSVGGVCSPARFSPWPTPQSQGTGHVLGAEGDESPRVGLLGLL